MGFVTFLDALQSYGFYFLKEDVDLGIKKKIYIYNNVDNNLRNMNTKIQTGETTGQHQNKTENQAQLPQQLMCGIFKLAVRSLKIK